MITDEIVTDYWAVKTFTTPASIMEQNNRIALSNGLVERILSVKDNMSTVSYRNLYMDTDMLVSAEPQPEAVIDLDGITFRVGGNGPASHTFKYKGYTVGHPIKRYEWTPSSYSDPLGRDTPWPAIGRSIAIEYEARPDFPIQYQNLLIEIRYEIYQGIPVISKVLKVKNNGSFDPVITALTTEQLIMDSAHKDLMYVETDFKGHDKNIYRNNDINRTVNWIDHPDGNCILTSKFTIGPEWPLKSGTSFESFITFELLHSVEAFEWKMMEIKKMYRLLFPQIMDNPIYMHLISDDDAVVRAAIDQAADAGFEMIIQSFGSGMNIESTDQDYIDRHKALYDYAHSKGMKIGAYTMLSARDDGPLSDSYDSDVWGRMRDLTSPTFHTYWSSVKRFIDQTGLDVIEIDGAYPMAINPANPLHSQVAQWFNSTVQMGKDLRERGIYVNAADWLYLNGSNKNGIGYEEIAWSQPRQEQIVYGRQAIYNGTYQKMPSMGWTFVAIDVYHGGGAEATFEPLTANIKDFDFVLAQNFGSGVMAAYRGKKLYDSDTTRAVVRKWTSFYKKYRAILNSDIVHIKSPEFSPSNAQRTSGLDAIIHVNPLTKEKGLMMVYNQTDSPRTETLTVPLFYTGLTSLQHPPAPVPGSHPKPMKAYGEWPVWDPYLLEAPPVYDYPAATPKGRQVVVMQEGISAETYTIDSNGNVRVDVTLPPMSYSWFALYSPEEAPKPNPISTSISAIATDATDNEVTLSWSTEISPESYSGGFHIYRNGVLIAKTFNQTFTDHGLTEQTRYRYEIAVVNPCGSLEDSKSAAFEVITKPDITPPILIQAIVDSDSAIRLEFNEPISRNSAEAIANYKLDNGGKVVSASLQADHRTVILITSSLHTDIVYEVTVNHIKDTSLQENTIAADSKMKFQFGLVRHYKFDETSGTVVHDLCIGKHTTIMGGAVRSAGATGQELWLNGTSGYVDLGGGIIEKSPQFSVEARIKPEIVSGVSCQTILAQQQMMVPRYKWSLYLSDGRLYFTMSDDSGEHAILVGDNTTPSIAAGEWSHVALTRDLHTFKLYLNGEIIASGQSASYLAQPANPNNMYIGADLNYAGSGPANLFKGGIGEVRLYTAALSDDTIRQHHERGSDAPNNPSADSGPNPLLERKSNW